MIFWFLAMKVIDLKNLLISRDKPILNKKVHFVYIFFSYFDRLSSVKWDTLRQVFLK